ncbi:hypothetical protein EMCRGX_G031216 [Ephydatia muelleri]
MASGFVGSKDGKDAKRAYRQKCEGFITEDGLLFKTKRWKKGLMSVQEEERYRVVTVDEKLSQIQPTNLHSHEQTKQPSDQTLKCYASSNSFNEVKSVTKIASEELEFTICDISYTSCEAENEPMIQTNSGTQHFVMKSDFQQLLNGECFGDNIINFFEDRAEHLRLICKNLVKSGFFDVYIQGKRDGVFSSINPTELKSLFRKWPIINCKVVEAVQHFLYGIAIDEGYGGNRANILAWDVLYPELMISIISKSKEMNYEEAELYYVDNLLN